MGTPLLNRAPASRRQSDLLVDVVLPDAAGPFPGGEITTPTPTALVTALPRPGPLPGLVPVPFPGPIPGSPGPSLGPQAHGGGAILPSLPLPRRQFKNLFKQQFKLPRGVGVGVFTSLPKDFEDRIDDERVKAWFKMLDMDVDDAWTLFQLLDRDETGLIEFDEFVNGCLHLQGLNGFSGDTISNFDRNLLLTGSSPLISCGPIYP
jgi:hypothetical protein